MSSSVVQLTGPTPSQTTESQVGGPALAQGTFPPGDSDDIATQASEDIAIEALQDMSGLSGELGSEGQDNSNINLSGLSINSLNTPHRSEDEEEAKKKGQGKVTLMSMTLNNERLTLRGVNCNNNHDSIRILKLVL